MNKTLKPVHELLYMSLEAYEEYYTERYLNWCIDKASDLKQDLQKIIANSKINAWYNLEHEKLTERFQQIATPQHGMIDFKSARTIFTSVTAVIYKQYPQPLIDSARNLKINAE